MHVKNLIFLLLCVLVTVLDLLATTTAREPYHNGSIYVHHADVQSRKKGGRLSVGYKRGTGYGSYIMNSPSDNKNVGRDAFFLLSYIHTKNSGQRCSFSSCIHIVLFIAILGALLVYTSFGRQTTTITINNKSYSTFELLQTKTLSTLRCPCSNTAVQYWSYSRISSTSHQVCLKRTRGDLHRWEFLLGVLKLINH